jgi:hypothetical protein
MTMERQRMTWNGGDLEKDSTKHAAEAPAVPNEGPASPAYKADPGPDDYKNGDTSSWAEDPHPGPYENGEHPATPDEGTSHPAAKAASVEDLERRAAKCIRIATAMLGEGATVAAIEDQALTLMDLSDSAIKASLDRLSGGESKGDQSKSHEDYAGAKDGDKETGKGESAGDQSKSHLDYEGDDKDKKKAADKTAAFEDRISSIERFLSKAGYSYMQEEAALGEIEAEDTEGMEEEAMLEKMLQEEGMYGAVDPGEIEAEDVEGMLQEMMAEEGMSDFNEVAAEAEAHADGKDQNDPEAFYADGGAEMSPAAMKEEMHHEEAASEDPGDHDSLALPGGSDETMQMFAEEEVVDPMGVLSTDLNEDEGDLLSRLFSDRRADDDDDDDEDKEEKEDHDKGAIKDDEDHIEDLEDDEKDEKKDLKKEEKKASLKPQPKKASKGAKTLGGVSKEAASEVNDLAKLWESAPDVSRFF